MFSWFETTKGNPRLTIGQNVIVDFSNVYMEDADIRTSRDVGLMYVSYDTPFEKVVENLCSLFAKSRGWQ